MSKGVKIIETNDMNLNLIDSCKGHVSICNDFDLARYSEIANGPLATSKPSATHVSTTSQLAWQLLKKLELE